MKKAANKLMSFLAAFAMVIGVLVAPFANANAAEDTETTESVTIHKILLTKEALDAHNKDKKYDGDSIKDIKKFFDDGTAEEIDGVYFKLQSLKKGITEDKIDVNNDEQWEDVADKAGLTGSVYKDGEGKVVDKKAEGAKKVPGLEIDTTGLKGTYRIVEDLTKSTYKGKDGELLANSKAVPTLLTLPITNDKGVVKEAHVYPKNTQQKPQIDKNFTSDSKLEHAEGFDKAAEGAGANVGADYDNYAKTKETAKAYVGKKIPYDVKTKILKDSHYKKLVWSDEMTKGLTYNKDLTVSGAGLAEDDYRVVASEQGFVLELLKSGLDKVEEAAKTEDVEITLTYSATVNSEAVVDKPDDNIIKLDYSNNPSNDNESKTVKPKNQEIKVTKTWAEGPVTEHDKDAKVVYILQKKDGKDWTDEQSVTKTYQEKDGQPDQESFDHTFTGLDNESEYRVIERVSGYAPEYIETNEDGTVKINNEKDEKNPKTLQPTKVSVVTGGKKFVKTNNEDVDSKDLERLAGAEFYVTDGNGQYLVEKMTDKNTVKEAKKALDAAVEHYNNLEENQQTEEEKGKVDKAQEAYDKAVKANASGYEWGNKKDAIVLTSDKDGKFEITGLEYGNYKLEEYKAPDGYAKLDPKEEQLEFEVKKGSYSTEDVNIKYNAADNDESAKQIRNKNVTIPQTGGIGSLIFVVAGLALMAVAFVAMKRRNSYEA